MKKIINYDVKCKVEVIGRDNKQIRIPALPIGQWTGNYKKSLEDMMGERRLFQTFVLIIQISF